MKRIFYSLFIALSLVSTILSSCKKENSCEDGYEGTNCATKFSEKYINSSGWVALDNVTSSTYGTPLGNFNYVPTLSVMDAKQIKVSGMSGYADATVVFFLTSSREFNFSAFGPTDRLYAGTGSISSDGRKINIVYSVTYLDGTKDNITATWSKN